MCSGHSGNGSDYFDSLGSGVGALVGIDPIVLLLARRDGAASAEGCAGDRLFSTLPDALFGLIFDDS